MFPAHEKLNMLYRASKRARNEGSSSDSDTPELEIHLPDMNPLTRNVAEPGAPSTPPRNIIRKADLYGETGTPAMSSIGGLNLEERVYDDGESVLDTAISNDQKWEQLKTELVRYKESGELIQSFPYIDAMLRKLVVV